MPLILDVLTHIDERSAAAGARELEQQFERSGEAAGVSFGGNLARGLTGGFRAADFESMTGVLSSAGMLGQAASHGKALGVAFAGGLTVAAAAGIVDLGVKVGETFEKINRDITLHTAASGKALDDLKTHADALVGSLDFDPSKTGANMAILGTRLQMGIGKPLDDLTKNVGMLQDRLGNFDAGVLAGALANMGVTGATANDVLDSLTQTVQRTSIPFAQLTTDLAANSELFKDLHLTAEQGAAMLGQLSEKGIPAATAMMGLQMGMKAAAKEGEDFNTFINRISATLQAMGAAGDEAGAEKLSLAIGGPRKWTDEVAAINALQAARSSAYAGDAADLAKLDLATRTLGDEWELVKNKISSALAPPGLSVTDEVKEKMESLMGFIDAHATDLRNMFESALNVIGQVLQGVGAIAGVIDRIPGGVQTVVAAFAAWEAFKGVDALLTGLEAVGAWLVGAPAVAATSAAGVSAAAAGGAAAVTASAAGAATAATGSMGALEAASAAGLASVTAAAAGTDAEVAASAAAVATAAAEAAAAVAAAAGTGEAALAAAAAAGAAAVTAAAAEADAAVAAGAAVAATAVTTSMTAADAAVLSLNATLDATVASLAAIATSPAIAVIAGLAALFGLSIATGSATGQADLDTTPFNPGGRAPSAGGGGPGTGRFAPGQGPDVGARAGPGLPGSTVVPGGAAGAVLTPGELSTIEGDGKPKGPRLPVAPQVPYGAGYGAPPGPGESAEQYSAQQSILEKRHDIDEAQARLNQLEQDNNATADDIQKAKNALLHAQSDEYKAELEQTKKHAGDMQEFGAKIDKDFGISKGLAGIAENLTKFVANLAFAPVFGAMGGAQAALGFPGGKGLGGAGGLIGASALGGAFGPQYTVAGGAGGPSAGGRGAGGGGGGGSAGTASYTSPSLPSIGSPEDLAAAGGGVANLFRVAEALEGTPYSMALRNDCSGMVSKLASAAVGLPPAASFSTANEGQWLGAHGFQQGQGGPGDMNIGWHQGGPGGGHTAATLPGGVNAESGGSNSSFTLGPRAAGASNPEFDQHMYLPMGGAPPPRPGFAEGGTLGSQSASAGTVPRGGAPAGTDTVPAMLSPGEHVLTTQDVNAMGGQQGVYDFRAGLHAPQPSTAGGSGATQIGGLGAMKGLGSGYTVTGGGLIGVAESIPATAASMAMSFAAHGGAAEDLAHFAAGGAVSYFGAGGAGGDGDPGAAGAGAAGAAGAGAGPAGAAAAGPSGAGGLGAAGAASGTGTGTGAGGGGAPGGSVAGALIGIGMQEMNEAISKSAQMAGAVVGGLQQTFGMQQFAQTPLAQSGWLSRIVGGIAGAQPQLPNLGGQSAGKASPEGTPGMSPMMTPPQEVSPFGPGRGASPGPSGPPQAPAPPPHQPPGAPPPSSALGDAGVGPSPNAFQGPPTPNSVVGGSGGFRGFAQGGDVSGSGSAGGGGSNAAAVHIEHYHDEGSSNSAGQDIARHVESSYSAQQNTGSR